ncbi:MAG: hypothetical protein HQL11_01830 [Candidatus Omnitrophica bacterium]|nr:hypothetical protein [Candidatus Omnitrophota bacterium]
MGQKILKVVNPILIVVAGIQLATVVLMVAHLNLFGMESEEIHEVNGFVLLALIGVHLFLNRGWMFAAYRRKN